MSFFDDLSNHFDENIPQEVLNSDSWNPRLLPDLNSLKEPVTSINDFGFEDIIEDFD